MQHIIFLLSFLLTLPKLNKKLPFYMFSLLLLLLFMSLRYDFGNDYMSYLEAYKLINLGVRTHVGNSYMYKQLNLYMPNFNILISIISLFYLIVVGNIIKKNIIKKDYWFSVLILLINPYLFLIHLSALRQTLAILFFIISIKFIIEKKVIKYLLMILIAMGFHRSAVVLLPLYFIVNNKLMSKKIIILNSSILLILLFTPTFEIILSNVMYYFPRYQFYTDNLQNNSVRATIISSTYFIFVVLNINKLDKKEIIYGKLYLLGTVISLLAIKLSIITRIGMYFDILMIITIPQLFNKIRNKNYRYILFTFFITIFFMRYVSFFRNSMWIKFVKYKTILQV